MSRVRIGPVPAIFRGSRRRFRLVAPLPVCSSGMVGTVLIQRGTLRVGDIFVAGEAWGKVRTIIDHAGRRIREAGPSTPVQVGGFDGVPDAGDTFTVVDREDMARDLAEARRKLAREASAATLQVRSDVMSASMPGLVLVVVRSESPIYPLSHLCFCLVLYLFVYYSFNFVLFFVYNLFICLLFISFFVIYYCPSVQAHPLMFKVKGLQHPGFTLKTSSNSSGPSVSVRLGPSWSFAVQDPFQAGVNVRYVGEKLACIYDIQC